MDEVLLSRSWTQEEFFAWDGHQDGRYEFDGVQPVAMTGGTANHSLITQNVLAALREHLRGSACRALGPDAGVATVANAVRYPDALVTCSKFDGNALLIPGVMVVFEVTSPSTGRTDRFVKLREYAGVASIRRYVIVESDHIEMTVFERPDASQPWTATTLTGGDVLRMRELNTEITVDAFYADIDFSGDREADAD
jgi:Uma2 family endonuclease